VASKGNKLTNRRVHEEWGEERLIEFAKTCHGLPAPHAVKRILAAAQAFAEGASQHDDMTLVVLRAAG